LVLTSKKAKSKSITKISLYRVHPDVFRIVQNSENHENNALKFGSYEQEGKKQIHYKNQSL
jgi:hypothetical protein